MKRSHRTKGESQNGKTEKKGRKSLLINGLQSQMSDTSGLGKGPDIAPFDLTIEATTLLTKGVLEGRH